MKVRNLVAGLAGLGLVTAGMAVTAPAAAAAGAASVPAMSGYIDTEPSVSGRTYDSAGGTPSVTSIGTGQYLVEFPNLSALSDGGGNFEVTPVQTAHNCSVASWETGTGGTLIVYVNCYLLTSLTDTYFDLSVTRAGTVEPRPARLRVDREQEQVVHALRQGAVQLRAQAQHRQAPGHRPV